MASVKRAKKPERHVVVERITKRNPAAERIARRNAVKRVRRAPTGPKPEPELRPARDRGRRALSHVGGAIQLVGGSEAEQKALKSALSVRSDEESTQAHVHGFHSYPARLHPLTARRLIEGLSAPGARVLDPFCGSGTVLVEARLLGRAAFGVDVNPLAIELSEFKTNGPGAPWAKRLVQVAARVAEHANERRLTKAGATMRYEKADVELFAPNVLLELDSLKHGLGRVEDPMLARALFIVLSAVLTKVSARAGDTGRLEGAKRLPAGFTARVFRQKAEELARRLDEAAALVPRGAPLAHVVHGDARDLHFISDGKVDLAVSSPPYAGVYDYVVHHRDRLRWLSLPEDRFAEHEIGARRHARGATFEHAISRFRSELGAAMRELGRTLAPGGVAVLVIADSVLGGRAVYAEELVGSLCQSSGLMVGATASQKRPHVHAPTQDAFSARPRREHAILLRRAASRNPIRPR